MSVMHQFSTGEVATAANLNNNFSWPNALTITAKTKDVLYQNTTGGPMFVNMVFSTPSGGIGGVVTNATVKEGSTNTPAFLSYVQHVNMSPTTDYIPYAMMVPAQFYYTVSSGVAGCNVNYWNEWTLS